MFGIKFQWILFVWWVCVPAGAWLFSCVMPSAFMSNEWFGAEGWHACDAKYRWNMNSQSRRWNTEHMPVCINHLICTYQICPVHKRQKASANMPHLHKHTHTHLSSPTHRSFHDCHSAVVHLRTPNGHKGHYVTLHDKFTAWVNINRIDLQVIYK